MAIDITDIERAAVTLLAQTQITNDKLHEYVHSIARDPEFSEWMDQGLLDILSYRNGVVRFSPEDRATALLACSVTQYRRDGRPTGDTTKDVGGLEISTSLAADVVDFHSAILNAMATRVRKARERQRTE